MLLLTIVLSCPASFRYDLLAEEDPDDFVSVDIPEDLSTSDVAVLPASDSMFCIILILLYVHAKYIFIHTYVHVHTSSTAQMQGTRQTCVPTGLPPCMYKPFINMYMYV